MASYPLTSGDGDGFAIHLQASKLIREVIKKAEDHFTWLEEILVETKKAFKTSEIELLPKTPSVKNKKRKGRKAASDEDTSTGGEEPPTKQRRGAKKKLAADYSPGPKVDSDAETTEEINEEKATRPKRNTRNQSRSANTTRSSRARNPRARSAKSQKDYSDEVEPETPAPVICLENSLICDTISEESEVTKKTPNKVDHKPSDEDEMEVEENIEKVEVVTEHAKTLVSKSVDTMEEETEKKGMTPVNKCTKGLNRSINHSPKPSPKAIAGFCLLNVKAKAHAYEEHYMSDDSATSTTPRGNKTKKCALKDLDNEATPKVQVIDSSPSDEGENTPNVLPSTPSTPSTVIYKSTASVTLGGNKTKARVALADREETESEKVSSTDDKVVHSTETESSEKESENEGPEEEVVVVEDETPRRVSRRHSTRRSTRMSHSKITRVSLSQRRSSVRNRASVKIIAAVKKAQEIRQQVMEEKMRGTPESSRTCTRSKLRLNKAGRQVPSTQNNLQTPTEAPLRSTRSKMRVNKPPRPDMTSSSDETDAVTSVPQPTRSTRSKMRQPPAKPTTPSTPTTEEHTEDEEEEEPGTPVIQPPSSMMPTRTTRSKARQTKPHRAAELAAAAESEDESATPTCDQAGYSKPEAGPRTTRSKMRKRQITPEDTQTPPKAVPSPPKKQCLDTPDNTNWEDENSDGYVERTPSPQCPRGKIVRPKGALSASSQRTYSNMRTTIVSFIKRNTPTKVTQKEKDQQKAVAVQNKSKLIEERVKQAMDAKKMQAEERKRLREERMKRVLDKKELLEKEKLNQQHKKNNFESKANNYMKVQEKQRDEREKLKQVRDQKLKEAEERRRAEEEQRQQKQHELEEEHRRREEMMTRKKEFADQERLRKIEEERKKKEEKMAEMERERIQEQEKQMQLEEEREAERQRQKEEREKAAARERAERERAELEKQREKERVMKDQLEKDKERERQRLREEAARREEERKANREAQQISTLIQKHNSSVNNASNTSTSTASASSASKPTLNTSYTVSKETTAASRVSPQSYEITPDKKYKKSTANDYGIDELRSDDSTDDDEAPRKVVPQWAKGPCLKAALINQYYHPPCLDDIFDIILPPDLNVLFKKRRPRFNKRTSSAIWNSPILKPGQVC